MVERWNGDSLNIAADSPRPKAIGAAGGKALGGLIPKPEVELDGQRHFRVVIIAVGTPTGLPDHGRKVIDRDFSLLTERLIAERPDRIEGAFHGWWRAIEIQIVLRALAQVITVVGPLREPLENHKLDSSRG